MVGGIGRVECNHDEMVEIPSASMNPQIRPARMATERPENADYPYDAVTPAQQTITVVVNKKEIKIYPAPHSPYGTLEVKSGDERYQLKLDKLYKITKKLAVCLAQHAVRLKKNITFLGSRSELVDIGVETNKNEITFLRFDTEHYTAKVTRVRHLDFPNHKVKCEEIEERVGRRMRLFALPEAKEKVGYEFKDLKNNPIAYMSTNWGTVMLLWNILMYREVQIEHSIAYLDYVLYNYSAKCDEVKLKAMDKIEQAREEKKRREYNNFIDKMFRDSINAIQNRMHQNLQDMDSHMRGLHTKGQEMCRDEEFLVKLKNRATSKEIKTQLEADYKLISKLKKTNKYTNFRFEAGAIVGRTSMIKFFNKYNIGEFDVCLSLNGVIKCHNKTYRTEDGEFDHPHVNHGTPCFGNLGDAVLKMLRSNQFGAAFDVMYEFLSRYNDGLAEGGQAKPYRRLEKWNPAFIQQGLKVCTNCHRITELCRCELNGGSQIGSCNVCGDSFRDCSCRRCPAEPLPNNIIGVQVDCNSDCEHYDEDDEAENHCSY